jgi:hypothetical protein
MDSRSVNQEGWNLMPMTPLTETLDFMCSSSWKSLYQSAWWN